MYKSRRFVLNYLQNFLVELIFFIVITNDTNILAKLPIYASYSQLSILCTYLYQDTGNAIS